MPHALPHGKLRRWRAAELDEEPEAIYRRGELLDYVNQHLDVPRYTSTGTAAKVWVQQLGTVEAHMTALHLSNIDAAAFAVLLAGLPGNKTDASPAWSSREGLADSIRFGVVSTAVLRGSSGAR